MNTPHEREFANAVLPALIARADADGLAALLIAGSRLPGPRANLALAVRFADLVAASGNRERLWPMLLTWLVLPPAAAPAGDPHEFLPFCAAQGLGALYPSVDATRQKAIVSLLRIAADDERWRLREAVAIALQRIGEQDVEALRAVVDDWLPTASVTEQRAIMAALAHTPILKDEATARYALGIAGAIMQNVQQADAAQRKTESFRILRKALEYALSVYIAALSAAGIPFLSHWQVSDDPAIQRIVSQNLGKARLQRVMDGGVKGEKENEGHR